MKKITALAILSIAFSLMGCGNSASSSSVISLSSAISPSEVSSIKPSESSKLTESSILSTPSSEKENKALKFFQNKEFGKAKEMPSHIDSFNPTLFDKTSFTTDSTNNLGEGVDHITYSFNLNNGNKVVMHTIQVDTNKASIRSSNATTIDSVNNQIVAFEEKNSDVKVIAGVNADFFATGTGGSSVNAYVQDKTIIKAGHNDTGYYDYTDTRSDVPASNPMLLGVSGSHAMIGAIVEGKDKKTTIQSKFNFAIYASTGEDTPTHLEGETLYNKSKLSKSMFDLIDNGMKFYSQEGDIALKIKPILDKQSSFTYGQIESVTTLHGELFNTRDDFNNGYTYLFVSGKCEHSFACNDLVGYTLDNDDSRWLGYSTVIGGRQALVENGEISSTVTLENTNGAQRSDIPRTCAGIKVDGKVVIAVCEALRYGSKSTSTSDPYGVNLPELADFMRYIGCYDALNFDGGGSTQLITSSNNGTSKKEAVIRSSDYGTSGINDARKVYNTLLVTTK